ncbi:urea ABC transporter permease subunit UrtB [Marivibrio halodurans]|uniref:Urea ABC transporter permease subunit UrtB n=2 Tax=Marivibrio halodurans TaxID=2039722 RepID=A0A8J7S1P7_9PROT|nr:urea ABC transporter permease subunit UrtB [Marivibrio halodurans]
MMLLFLAALSPLPAAAQSDNPALAPHLAALDSRDFAAKGRAVEAIAQLDDPVVVPLLRTLGAGDLYRRKSDGLFFRAERDGRDYKLFDLQSGDLVETLSGSAVTRIIVNNSMRGQIDALLGSLTLRADDPAQRLAAARTIFEERDPATLPALESAIAAEDDDDIRALMETARAAILVADDGALTESRLEAVSVLRAMGGREAMVILKGASGDEAPAIAEAAAEGAAAIEQTMQLWGLGQNVWYGLSLGSVLLLAAIGLAITFGVMGVINMAHGELVMLGAYTTFAVQEVIRNSAPWLFDYSLLIAAPLAFAVVGLAGVAIERGVVRFLYGRPLETLLATWGISLILQQAVRSIFGPTNKEVGNPSWMTGGFELGYLTITYNRLWILVFALAVFAGLLALLKKTPAGLQMRAVTQNRAMASDLGVKSGFVDAMTFGLGAGVAGLAGVALSQIDNVSPNLGQGYIVDSFMVVVFGGAGNLWGALAGAFTLGIANKFLEPFSGAVLAKVLVLVFIIIFIQKRPRGLFPVKGRAAEN